MSRNHRSKSGLADSDSSNDLVALPNQRLPEAKLDMTSMVDVTFLLLIFFMVTASFGIMRAINPNLPESLTITTKPAATDSELELVVDENGSFYVKAPNEIEVEAASETELRSLVRQICNEQTIERIMVTSHPDARHDRFVVAWDAGRMTGTKTLTSRMLSPGF
jgi:biopolymer transport protein ExbD